MELGATVCTPKKPSCLTCPWSKSCLAFQDQSEEKVPIQKPKKPKEVWIWSPLVYKNNKNELLLVENNDISFLNKKWVFPGTAKKVLKKPNQYSYKHCITNHEIYVCVENSKTKPVLKTKKLLFIKPEELAKKSPFSLIKKALVYIK